MLHIRVFKITHSLQISPGFIIHIQTIFVSGKGIHVLIYMLNKDPMNDQMLNWIEVQAEETMYLGRAHMQAHILI